MCTATWWFSPSGYEVFFNRDEQRTRPAALVPEVSELDCVSYVSPTDSQAGGTWILSNAWGVTVGLLNFYSATAQVPASELRSRGLLVKGLASCRTVEAVAAELNHCELIQYAPFHLFALSCENPGEVWSWDGQTLEHQSGGLALLPLTSSSFRSDEVIAARRQRYADFLQERGAMAEVDLRDFHYDQHPESGPFSVLMSREDAQTVSFSRIRVSPEQVRFEYAPRSESGLGFDDPVICSLDRIR